MALAALVPAVLSHGIAPGVTRLPGASYQGDRLTGEATPREDEGFVVSPKGGSA